MSTIFYCCILNPQDDEDGADVVDTREEGMEKLGKKGFKWIDCSGSQVAFSTKDRTFAQFKAATEELTTDNMLFCCVKEIPDPGLGLMGIVDHDELDPLGFDDRCDCKECMAKLRLSEV